MNTGFSLCVVLPLVLGLFLVSDVYSDDRFQSVYDSALELRSIDKAKQALAVAEKLEDHSNIAESCFLIAFLQDRERMYYESLNHYFLALKHFRKAGNISKQGRMLTNIGIIYTKGGFFEKSISFYRDALALLADSSKADGLTLRYQIARAHRLTESYEKARDIYTELIPAYEVLDNEYMMSDCYLELGVIAIKEKDYERADLLYSKAVEVFSSESKYKDRAMISAMNSLAYVKKEQGFLDEAKTDLLAALRISNDTAFHRNHLTHIYSNLGDIYDKKSLVDSAVLMYEKRLLYNELGAQNENYLETARYVYQHYHARNHGRALLYYDRTYDFAKELATFQKTLLQSYDRYQVEAANYKHENQLMFERQRQRAIMHFIAYLGIGVVLCCGVGAYFYQRQKRIKYLRGVIREEQLRTNSAMVS